MTAIEPAATPGASDGTPYPDWAVPAAGFATLVAPFISIVAAAVMLSSEKDEGRRKFLRTWLIVSGAWLAIGGIIAIALFAGATSASASCNGGFDRMDPPTYQSTDGKHWTATYMCFNGGSKTVAVRHVPAWMRTGGGK